MKKIVSVLMILLMLPICTGIMISAEEIEPLGYAPIDNSSEDSFGNEQDFARTGTNADSVPRIDIDTENGRGAALLKSDGYVNARITITDTDNTVLNGNVSFKVRGNSTAMDSISKKGFTFKFDKKTEILGMGKGKKWVLLANCFDPSLLRNYTVFELAKELRLPYTSEQRFVELYLDGSYHGCYTLYEPVQQGKDRVDIDIESNDGKKDFLLEYEATRVEDDETYLTVSGHRFIISEPEEPDDGQIEYISDVMTDIINTLKNGSEAEIRRKIDLDSFAAYYLLNEYAKTADFGYSSVFFFYKNGKLYAGPPWDYDLALGNLNGNLNSSSAKAASVSDGIMQSNKNLYRYLCGKDWFLTKIRRVYHRNFDYIESISKEGGLLDDLREQYADVFSHNFEKWRVNRWWLNYQKVPLNTYEENFDFLKSWCSERCAWLNEYYKLDEDSGYVGDADADCCITVIDATCIQRYLCDSAFLCLIEAAADVDGDGSISVIDATWIQRRLSEIEIPDSVYQRLEYEYIQ